MKKKILEKKNFRQRFQKENRKFLAQIGPTTEKNSGVDKSSLIKNFDVMGKNAGVHVFAYLASSFTPHSRFLIKIFCEVFCDKCDMF